MKRFSRILHYLKDRKQNIVLYVVFNISSLAFSLVSLGLLGPFLQMLFGLDKQILIKPKLELSSKSLLDTLNYELSQLIVQHDKVYALAAICILIIISVFFQESVHLSFLSSTGSYA